VKAVARLKYLVIAQSLNIWAVRLPNNSSCGESLQLLLFGVQYSQ